MNAALRAKLDNMLAMHGLGRLSDPGLPAQLAYLVRDHDHFRQLISACEPEHRADMYSALAPNLRFEAKPLSVYITDAKADAERRQLPTIGPNGELQAYKPPELTLVQTLVEDAMAKGWLTLVCRKCTREESFSGRDRSDAIKKAREAGWTYREDVHDAVTPKVFEVCPQCP